MAFCPKCGSNIEEGARFCPTCGEPIGAAQNQTQNQPQPQAPVQNFNENTNDHTAEFDAQDISSNKILAMGCYLFGLIGIIISLLAAKDSKYAAFHARNAMKLTISSILLIVCSIIPFLGWFVTIVGEIMVLVVEIICFVQVCCGKAKDAPIFGRLPFFK